MTKTNRAAQTTPCCSTLWSTFWTTYHVNWKPAPETGTTLGSTRKWNNSTVPTFDSTMSPVPNAWLCSFISDDIVNPWRLFMTITVLLRFVMLWYNLFTMNLEHSRNKDMVYSKMKISTTREMKWFLNFYNKTQIVEKDQE